MKDKTKEDMYSGIVILTFGFFLVMMAVAVAVGNPFSEKTAILVYAAWYVILEVIFIIIVRHDKNWKIDFSQFICFNAVILLISGMMLLVSEGIVDMYNLAKPNMAEILSGACKVMIGAVIITALIGVKYVVYKIFVKKDDTKKRNKKRRNKRK